MSRSFQLVSAAAMLLTMGAAHAQPAPTVPEPSIFGLLGIGALGLLVMRLRKRK